jgi:murein DD-endopeptidase MepM/ murein hydrolase activator NlpD
VLLVVAGGRVLGRATPPDRIAPTRLRLAPPAGAPLRVALLGAGLTADDADAAAQALDDALDAARPGPGLSVELRAERAADGPGLRLIDLVVRRDGRAIATLTRAADGDLRLAPAAGDAAAVADDGGGAEAPDVVQGPMEDVLYGGAPTDPALIAEATRLFARKLDMTRDIALGDRVRLVVARRGAREDGASRLLYAEIDTGRGPVQFYAHASGSAAEFVEPNGETGAGALLRTPLDAARLTSGFGMRLHPLLGFSRMHEGLDFGAPIGTPVLAASDGVVEEARWAGGYGRWIRLRHSASLETGYGHLSGWAPGLQPGQTVRQGQVIGYVGSTGLSTGPHLHFEVRLGGQPVDPRTFAPQSRTYLTGADLAQFAVEKRTVDLAIRQAALRLAGSG